MCNTSKRVEACGSHHIVCILCEYEVINIGQFKMQIFLLASYNLQFKRMTRIVYLTIYEKHSMTVVVLR